MNINSIWETLDNLEVERKKAILLRKSMRILLCFCIPMAFDDANQKGLIKKGDLVLFIGSVAD
ncbi:MAG: hypothetical protein IPJ23_09755 [Ignavibacteriales bacterium]|nr:hypothetical protein [Ignavibacteriales bacterium]